MCYKVSTINVGNLQNLFTNIVWIIYQLEFQCTYLYNFSFATASKHYEITLSRNAKHFNRALSTKPWLNHGLSFENPPLIAKCVFKSPVVSLPGNKPRPITPEGVFLKESVIHA